MQNTLKIALLSCFMAISYNAHSLDSYLSTHTYTPIELKPVSISEGLKYASVCFMGYGCLEDGGFNKGNNDGYELDTASQCIAEGFSLTKCIIPQYLSGQCPYNDKYYTKCETDNIRACLEEGYLKECEDSQTAETTCPYDSSYQKCKCAPCSGYDYTYEQATETGYVTDGSCLSCSETKYKRKPNPCSGYATCECGEEIGTSTCTTGTQLKYQSCKTCCKNQCGREHCPENQVCWYESCSAKYCFNGCVTGTEWNYVTCVNKARCAVSWVYYKDGTCVPPSQHMSGKEVLGIVASITDGTGLHGQIMSTKSIGDYHWSVGVNTAVWSLPNQAESNLARREFDSCGNTDKIMAAGDSNTYPAAWAARDYVPNNAPETKGKWCLPAYGVLDSIGENLSAINNTLSFLNEREYDEVGHTLSSTEKTETLIWLSPFYYEKVKGVRAGGNDTKANVRPVMEF